MLVFDLKAVKCVFIKLLLSNRFFSSFEYFCLLLLFILFMVVLLFFVLGVENANLFRSRLVCGQCGS